jgi:hypothetical protein
MIIAIKSNKIIATHDDSQSINVTHYPEADVILKVAGEYLPMQDYIVTEEQIAWTRIEQLWNSVKAYIDYRLDVAGYYVLDKMSTDVSKTKAKACIDWYNSCWAEYYIRRAQAAGGLNPSVDFSSLGELPYSFFEAFNQ